MFKVGDQVICIADTYKSIRGYLYGYTKVGSIYTIEEVDVDGTLILEYVKWWHDPKNFAHLTPASVLLYKNLPVGK